MANKAPFSRWTVIAPGPIRDAFANLFARLDAIDTRGTVGVVGDGTVTAAKLAIGAVTAAKLAAGAVGLAALGNGVVSLAKLGGDAGAAINGDVSFTVGLEAANAITVSIAVVDAKGAALTRAAVAQAWLSDTAGGAVSAVAPSGAVAASTGLLVRELAAKVHLLLATTAAGAAAVSITEAGAKTFYLNVEHGGRLYTSPAITFV